MLSSFSVYAMTENGSESYRIPAWNLTFSVFCARFRRATYNCTPCATKSNTPNDFISPLCGEAKKAQIEKADKSNYRTFIRHKLHKSRWNPIGFLRRNNYPLFLPPKTASSPYNCTATRRFSTLLHLFYLSPIRVGWKRRPKRRKQGIWWRL